MIRGFLINSLKMWDSECLAKDQTAAALAIGTKQPLIRAINATPSSPASLPAAAKAMYELKRKAVWNPEDQLKSVGLKIHLEIKLSPIAEKKAMAATKIIV